MPLATHGQQPYSAEDCKVFPFSAGVPGTGLDVPGFNTLTSDPQTTEAQNRGDNQVIASVSSLDSLDLTLTVGIWNVDAIAAIAGGTVVNAGTTPDQTRTLTHNVNDVKTDFALKVMAKSKSPDGGMVQIIFPRCQSKNVPGYGLADADFNNLDLDISAIPNTAGDIVSVKQYETAAAAISTTYTS